jgi:hypothetical protein
MTTRILLSLLLLFPLLFSAGAYAQFAQRGGLAGTVFDSSGAVVPACDITLLDVALNQSRHIKTDAAGHFEFNNLAAGQYQLTATAQGFATEQSHQITVNIGAIASYDFKLRAGSASQQITVTDQVGGLETDNATLDERFNTAA